MKKHTVFFLIALVLFFSAGSVFAQFIGPQIPTNQNVIFGQQGFIGPMQIVTVSQVIQIFPDKAQAVLRGNIVMYLGDDCYLFRDATGDFVLKIKNERWWGLTVGPNDLVEIGGELKRDKKTGMIKHFDVKSIRRA